MNEAHNLSEEIAKLDKMIEAIEVQLNEVRQQREFKVALLRQVQGQGTGYISAADLVQQRPDVISE